MRVLSSFAILAVVLTVACGQSGTTKKDDKPILPIPTVSIDPPATYYFVEDPDCLKAKEPMALTQSIVRSWSGPSIVGRNQDITTLKTTASLGGEAIAGTYYDRRYNRSCSDAGGSSYTCLNDDNREQPYSRRAEEHNQLRICRDKFEYANNSYEGVALSAAISIERTHKRIRGVAPDYTLKKVDLEVLPIFKSSWPNLGAESYITNNMAYFSDSDIRMIAVFPQAKADSNDQTRYWESSFAVAHEYGHHFQAAIADPNTKSTLALRWDPVLHSVRLDPTSANAVATSSGTRAVLTNLWTSIFEASADLFAYYSENMDSSSLVGLKSLGINRNIAFAAFSDDTPKVLNTRALTVLTNYARHAGDCDRPTVLCSAHNIGAIVAHAFDQIINTAQKTIYPSFDLPNAAQIDERFRMSIEWYRSFVNTTPVDSAHAEDPTRFYAGMGVAIENAVKVMIAGNQDKIDDAKLKALKEAVCEQSKALLPSAKPPYVDNDGGCAR